MDFHTPILVKGKHFAALWWNIVYIVNSASAINNTTRTPTAVHVNEPHTQMFSTSVADSSSCLFARCVHNDNTDVTRDERSILPGEFGLQSMCLQQYRSLPPSAIL